MTRKPLSQRSLILPPVTPRIVCAESSDAFRQRCPELFEVIPPPEPVPERYGRVHVSGKAKSGSP